MSLFDWLLVKRNLVVTKNIKKSNLKIPDGLWIKCEKCGLLMYHKTLKKNLKVCPQCMHHFPTSSYDRINQLLDSNSWQPLNNNLLYSSIKSFSILLSLLIFTLVSSYTLTKYIFYFYKFSSV